MLTNAVTATRQALAASGAASDMSHKHHRGHGSSPTMTMMPYDKDTCPVHNPHVLDPPMPSPLPPTDPQPQPLTHMSPATMTVCHCPVHAAATAAALDSRLLHSGPSHVSLAPTRVSPPTSMSHQPRCMPPPPPLPPARVACHPALSLALLPVEMYVTLLLACCPSRIHVNSQDLDMDHHCCCRCHWDILFSLLAFPFALQTQFASDNIKM